MNIMRFDGTLQGQSHLPGQRIFKGRVCPFCTSGAKLRTDHYLWECENVELSRLRQRYLIPTDEKFFGRWSRGLSEAE